MKKLLLLLAAVATCASAYAVDAELEYMTQASINSNVPTTNDNRQGFGMNGKFYLHDNANKKVAIYGQNGLENTLDLPEISSWPSITRDEAGNIIARIDNTWPSKWSLEEDVIRIFPADGSEPIDVALHADFVDWEGYACEGSGVGGPGREDFFGFAEGNVLEEGALFLTTWGATSIYKLVFVDGEIDGDNSTAYAVSGVNMGTANQSCVINPYIASDGTRHYLFVNRSAAPIDMTFDEDNNEFVGKTITLPNRGACNGIFPFSLGGYDLFLYPTTPNYRDGFAIAEAGASEPIVSVPETYSANPNGLQCNWLNAEPVAGSDTKATIYQYVPGGHMAVYDFKLKTTVTAVKDVNAAKQLTGVKYYNVAGVESATPFDGVNIVVNTYNDGSREATKVLR